MWTSARRGCRYELRYVMTDVNGLVVRHTAELDLKDETVPTEIQDCPKDIFVPRT